MAKSDTLRFAFTLNLDEHPLLSYLSKLSKRGSQPKELIRLAEIGALLLHDADVYSHINKKLRTSGNNQMRAALLGVDPNALIDPSEPIVDLGPAQELEAPIMKSSPMREQNAFDEDDELIDLSQPEPELEVKPAKKAVKQAQSAKKANKAKSSQAKEPDTETKAKSNKARASVLGGFLN